MGATVDIKFDADKLRKKLVISESQIEELGKDILIKMADRLVELIKEKAPRSKDSAAVGTHYADNWKREDPKDGAIAITNPDGLLYNVLEFTGRRKLHITPKEEGGVLHFVINGEDIFVKWSNPKETQPEPHVRPALEQLGREAKPMIMEVIKDKFPFFK